MSTTTITRPLDELYDRSTRPRNGELRLTRRGRLVVFVSAVVFLFVCGVLVAAGSMATGQAGAPEPTKVIVVHPGQTLWDIASKYAVDGRVDTAMTSLEQLNDLNAATLQVGQHLRVPVQQTR